MQEHKKIIVSQAKSLFWPIVWLILFWPVGLLWLIFRVKHNFNIEQNYTPIVLLSGAIVFYIMYAWVHHDWTLFPITWLGIHHENMYSNYYYAAETIWD